MVFQNLIGKRFGKLFVTELIEKNGTASVWKCVCDCGNTTFKDGYYLRNKRIAEKSCGCARGNAHRKHGKTNCRLYYVWQSMKRRCYCKSCIAYERYGGRGITVCREWNDDFQKFYDWSVKNGYDENAGHGISTLDRIDNNKNYSPDNCRWVNMEAQSNNRRDNILLEFDGDVGTISYWSKKTGINRNTIYLRYKRHNSIERILYKGKLQKESDNERNGAKRNGKYGSGSKAD